MRLLRIDHTTRLKYSEPAAESVIELRMSPPSTDDQTVLGFKLRTSPPARLTTYRDGFGNRVDLFNLLPRHAEIAVHSSSCVRLHRREMQPRAEAARWTGSPCQDLDAMEYLRPSRMIQFTDEVKEFCAGVKLPEGPLAGAVRTIVEAVRGRLEYIPKVTHADTTVAEALELGRGVCQDMAHLFLAAARHHGMPARYVSGYIDQPGEMATHAWVQVWGGPDCGWLDMDPTHGKWVAGEHIVTAVGRDFADVPPNRGAWRGDAEESIEVTVNVKPVERVPADLIELGEPPAWSSSVPNHRPRRNTRGGPVQQVRNPEIRQQQSQQQQ